MTEAPIAGLARISDKPRGCGPFLFCYPCSIVAPHVWSRFPFETDPAYAAFSEWLHTPDRPEIYEYARGKENTREILSWGLAGMWPDRAAAFDAWTAEKVVIRQFPLVSPLTLRMHRLALTELSRLEVQQGRTDIPGLIPLGAVLRMSAEVRKTEVEARKSQAELSRAAASGESSAYDFSRLTLEELRTLEALNEKARLSI